jgi:hypothetical protein
LTRRGAVRGEPDVGAATRLDRPDVSPTIAREMDRVGQLKAACILTA